MKKRISIIILVCITIIRISSAFAITDLEAQVYNHNSFADMTGATIIEGDPEIVSDNGATAYKFMVNDVTVLFITKDEKVVMVMITADDTHFSEFFSQCLSCMYNFKGVSLPYIWIQTFVEDLAASKAGKRSYDDIEEQYKKLEVFTHEGYYCFLLEK